VLLAHAAQFLAAIVNEPCMATTPLAAGAVLIIAGQLWSFWFPINKKLWTSSFVLFAAGFSLLLLALSIWIVDLRGARENSVDPAKRTRSFMPLLVFGMNAISAYILSELLSSVLSNIHVAPGVNVTEWAYRSILHVIPDAAFASLLYSLAFVAVCWVPMYVLYRRRIFLKI